MLRTIFLFMQAVFYTALFVGAISVYLFHDVDKDQIGHWNEAFAGLCGEMFLFTLVIGAGVALLTWIGRLVFHLKGYAPPAKLGLFLGVGVSAFQYLWDFVGRAVAPDFADAFLSAYMIVAIFVCSIVLVRDSFRQRKMSQAQATSSDGWAEVNSPENRSK
jgi:hypothetical protein